MKRSISIIHITVALLVTLMVGMGCAKVVITGRRQAKLIPSSQINSLSNQQYAQFLQENPPESNGADLAMVREVGVNIQRAVEKYYRANGMSDKLKEFSWEFNVVDDPTVNAFCMPGGKVVVYTGILPIAQGKDGLAVVMGHEIAHALAYHGNERMTQTLGVQGSLAAVDLLLSAQPASSSEERQKQERNRQIFMGAAGLGAQFGILLPFSRKHESEADQLGLYFMAIAGYDVNAAAPFWERMQAGAGATPPEFLSTHPSPATRSANLRKWAPEALEFAKKY
jgi:predicted Zn-dependent protease